MSVQYALLQLETAYRKSDSLGRWFRNIRIDSFRWVPWTSPLAVTYHTKVQQYRYTTWMHKYYLPCTSWKIHLL